MLIWVCYLLICLVLFHRMTSVCYVRALCHCVVSSDYVVLSCYDMSCHCIRVLLTVLCHWVTHDIIMSCFISLLFNRFVMYCDVTVLCQCRKSTCYVTELCRCAVSLCYVAVFVNQCTMHCMSVCYVSVLCQCVVSECYVTETRYHYVVLSHCTMSLFF